MAAPADALAFVAQLAAALTAAAAVAPAAYGMMPGAPFGGAGEAHVAPPAPDFVANTVAHTDVTGLPTVRSDAVFVETTAHSQLHTYQNLGERRLSYVEKAWACAARASFPLPLCQLTDGGKWLPAVLWNCKDKANRARGKAYGVFFVKKDDPAVWEYIPLDPPKFEMDSAGYVHANFASMPAEPEGWRAITTFEEWGARILSIYLAGYATKVAQMGVAKAAEKGFPLEIPKDGELQVDNAWFPALTEARKMLAGNKKAMALLSDDSEVRITRKPCA